MDKFLFLTLVFLQTITSKRLYTNKWIVHIKGEPKDAANIATRHGFVLHGEVRLCGFIFLVYIVF